MDGFYGGHRVGEWISNRLLLSYAGTNKHGQHLWNWQCGQCGCEWGPTKIAHMKRSKNCKNCSVGSNAGRWAGHEEISGVFLGSYKYNAQKRGIEWNVTPEYLWQVWLDQDGKCAYTGRQLVHGHDASLDRIDNTRGYVEDNVQWVQARINRLKSDLSEEIFLDLIEQVYMNRISK